MGRFYGLLIFLLLPCIVGGGLTDKIDLCPENKVCINFVKDSCENRGVSTSGLSGVVWEDSTTCFDGGYDTMWASLAFQLNSLGAWSVVVTTVHPSYIQHIEFSFANADLKFTTDTAELDWKSGSAKFPMTKLDDINRGAFKLLPSNRHYQYSFDISANGQKLISLLGGPTVVYKSKLEPYTITLTSARFSELLNEKTNCDIKEINEKCDGSCDELTKASSSVICPSKLWYRDPEVDQQWKKIKNVKCHMGSWLAEWSGGAPLTIDSSTEIQCSAKKPTASHQRVSEGNMGLIIGFVFGGLVLLIIAVIAVGFFAWRRNKNGKKDTLRGSDSKAQTPRDSKRSNTPRDSDSKAQTPKDSRKSDRPSVSLDTVNLSVTGDQQTGASSKKTIKSKKAERAAAAAAAARTPK